MTKLCPRGKAAAKRKFRVYPSAYANAYASKICAGKIKDPSGTKRKDWGPKKANKGMLMEKAKKAYDLTQKHDTYARSGVSPKGRLKIALNRIKQGKNPVFKTSSENKSMIRDMQKVKKANKGLHAETKKVKQVDPRKGLEFKKGRPPKGKTNHLNNPVVVRSASKGRMFTAAQVRALDESTGPKVNPKKKERIMQSGDKDKIKLSKTNLKRYNIGALAEEVPDYRRSQKYKNKKRGNPERAINPDYKGQKMKREMPFTGKSRTGEIKKPQGMMGGGMARGMGAAIKGGKFEGVF